MLSVTNPEGTWNYEYDPFGHRIASTHDGVRTEYVIDPAGGAVTGEYAGGALVARYVDGLGLAGRIDSSQRQDFYDFDGVYVTVQTDVRPGFDYPDISSVVRAPNGMWSESCSTGG